MLIHPQFDPIAFSIGPLGVHWYGLMYLLGFLAFWLLGRRRAQDYWRGVTPTMLRTFFSGAFWRCAGRQAGLLSFLSACVVLDPSPSDLLGLAGRNECAWRSVGSAYRDGALCSQTWHAVLAAERILWLRSYLWDFFSAASGTLSMASFGAGQLRRTFRGP